MHIEKCPKCGKWRPCETCIEVRESEDIVWCECSGKNKRGG